MPNTKIDLGCAEWCRYAEQCAGIQVSALRERLISEMKRVFGADKKRIDHALAVLNYAEQIQAEEGGDPLVVKAAAILHDIGILEAEQKYGSAAGKYQEIEGPPIAAEILKIHGVKAQDIEHICRIVGSHHSAKDIDTTEFRIVWDADRLVNLAADFPNADKWKLRKIIDKTFKTPKGRQIALELFVENPGQKPI
ncbi:MAG TPA: HD domain-containing protein [Sedimentisphaerales bacterium]|nr:HD domain-containing protein [Sedimentisphaerales bacterium]